jgi:hypothetical protein
VSWASAGRGLVNRFAPPPQRSAGGPHTHARTHVCTHTDDGRPLHARVPSAALTRGPPPPPQGLYQGGEPRVLMMRSEALGPFEGMPFNVTSLIIDPVHQSPSHHPTSDLPEAPPHVQPPPPNHGRRARACVRAYVSVSICMKCAHLYVESAILFGMACAF